MFVPLISWCQNQIRLVKKIPTTLRILAFVLVPVFLFNSVAPSFLSYENAIEVLEESEKEQKGHELEDDADEKDKLVDWENKIDEANRNIAASKMLHMLALEDYSQLFTPPPELV